jgi:hypothetical protein
MHLMIQFYSMLVATLAGPSLGALSQSPSDPRIDPAAQARLQALYKYDPYGGSEGRTRWKEDGKRAQWIVDFARSVRRVAPLYGLPPSPTDKFVTAHAAISTGYGRSRLVRVTRNAFGIKANNAASWPGPVVYSMTTEYKEGEPYRTATLWRVYKGDAAVRDHLRIVMTRSRYAKSADKLRRGSLDYMAQLGRDGWYTDTPEKIGSMWRGAMRIVEDTLANAPPEPSVPSRRPILIGLALFAGLGYVMWKEGLFT